MRTREQQIKDMEKRFKEIKAEAERRASDPQIQMPCKTCRWASTRGDNDFQWGPSWNDYYLRYFTCRSPLVVGYGKPPTLSSQPMPCGREKALWEPKPTIIQRAIEWLKLCGAEL